MRSHSAFIIELLNNCDVVHSYSVVHGDLTGVRLAWTLVERQSVNGYNFQSNVLIDAGGHARLSDFGLSTILAEFQGTSYFTSSIGGAVRWAAPELYYVPDTPEDDEDDFETSANALTEQSDIYSFGCIMLQVSGNSKFNIGRG